MKRSFKILCFMLKYTLIERRDMRRDAEPDAKLYYPQLVHNGRVEFETFCDEIAEQTSLTTGDVKNCVDRIVHNIAHHLREGRSVDCGDLGSFLLSLRSAGAATKKDYDVSELMRKAKVMFYPGTFNGQTLSLFDEFVDGNYYRAFNLL